MSKKKLLAAGIGSAAVIVGVGIGLGSSGNHKTPAASSIKVVASQFPTDPDGMTCVSLNTSGYCPGDGPASASASPDVTSAPATPAWTTSQTQAVDSAMGYLSDGQGFSKYSLTRQLTSQYGGGFSYSDADFAINFLHPDWYAQAVDAAKGYLSDGEGFSQASLLQQLTSQYGNGFTEGQAAYAVRVTMG